MSHKSKLSPLSRTRETPLRRPVSHSWRSSSLNLRDMKFLRSWLVYDSEIRTGLDRGRVNWNLVSGVALAIGVSAGFWAGVGLMVAHIWR